VIKLNKQTAVTFDINLVDSGHSCDSVNFDSGCQGKIHQIKQYFYYTETL